MQRMNARKALAAALAILFIGGVLFLVFGGVSAQLPSLTWGAQGSAVKQVQSKLSQWGYYGGSIDGYYGGATVDAVKRFQSKNGLRVDGIVGPQTYGALGLATSQYVVPTAQAAAAVSRGPDVDLLARVVAAEAQGEPYSGQVAVAAVILNRVRHPSFPNSLSGVVYQPHAFESVSNGLIWRRTPSSEAYQAAQAAMNGWDPAYGAIFFWNPSKPVSSWIWSRPIVVRIGNHVFAK